MKVAEDLMIIAEAGVNHNGSLQNALALVDVAVKAGASIVKFQTFSADKLTTAITGMAAYQKQNLRQDISQKDMLRGLELSWSDHQQVAQYCSDQGIEFLSTAFDEDNLAILVELGIQRIKIPSGELTNRPFLEAIGAYNLPTILSTGMANMQEIRDAVGVLLASGLAANKLSILHCTSNYPALFDELNLRAIVSIAAEFDVVVGYSDHSLGSAAAIASVALGARIIEKHITLDNSMTGPDHAASMEPEDFIAFAKVLHDIDRALGNGNKTPVSSEIATRNVARKSIVAAQPISKGTMFTTQNLAVKRPGTGLSPMLWYDVVGTIAVRDFAQDELIVQ